MMIRAKKESVAAEMARENGQLYGMSVFDGYYYTGNAEELRNVGATPINDAPEPAKTRPLDAFGEEMIPNQEPAEPDTDLEPEPAFFTVAPYLVWRQCGGPEEGGWYYDAGEPALESWLPLPVVCKTRKEACAARDAMQEALDADANVGLRDKYSVLSSGVYEAHVSDGYPRPFPVEHPFYE